MLPLSQEDFPLSTSSPLPPSSSSLPSNASSESLNDTPSEFNTKIRRRNPKVIVHHTKDVLSKQTNRIIKKASEHEHLINKLTYCIGVISFGVFCFLLGSRPHDIPYMYVAFFLTAIPLRWIYYRTKKWHYFLLDFCYYANLIFTIHLLFFHAHEKLFLLCFSFAEGPLAWALIVWRCSLVFSSLDKIVSVLIHLLPGTVIFIIRWWDPATLIHHPEEETGPWPAWPPVSDSRELWLWLFCVPLLAYSVWQLLYWFVVDYLRKQRLINDPEVMTSYRELSRKAAKANNFWWKMSGGLGDSNRVVMYAVFQAVFTVVTMSLAVPMFKSYHFHAAFQIFKILASIWNGCNFFFDVMPKQVTAAKEKKMAAQQLKQNGRIQMEDGSTNLSPIPSSPPPNTSEPCLQVQAMTNAGVQIKSEASSSSSSAFELMKIASENLCPACRKSSSSNLADVASNNVNGVDRAMFDQEKESYESSADTEDVVDGDDEFFELEGSLVGNLYQGSSCDEEGRDKSEKDAGSHGLQDGRHEEEGDSCLFTNDCDAGDVKEDEHFQTDGMLHANTNSDDDNNGQFIVQGYDNSIHINRHDAMACVH